MKRKLKRTAGIILVMAVVLTTTYRGNVWAADTPSDIEVILFSQDINTHIKGFMKDDCPVPYVDIEAYLNMVYSIDFSTEALGNTTYKIYNHKGSIIVDTENDTISSDKIEQFLYNDEQKDPNDDNSDVYERIVGLEYNEAPNSVVINLKNYGIDIISVDNRVYLPLTTLADFTAPTYCAARYKDNKISINYYIDTSFLNWIANYEAEYRDAKEVSYTYNELCFVMDYMYGCPPSCFLADSIKHNGFDTTLENFSDETSLVKACLQSDKTGEFLCGLAILAEMMYDGGHTDLSVFSYYISDTKAYQDFETILSNESDQRSKVYKKYYDANFEKHERSTVIQNYESGFDKYNKIFNENDYLYFEEGDTGIFVYYQYNEEVVRGFKKCLDIAKEHEMKNFLLDQAINSGGSSESLMYMMNAITGGNYKECRSKGALTDNSMKEILDFDMDQDGVFEGENEDFDYPFNYGVMCSAGSYSCSNLFPCFAKEMGIPIIGETSAGGTCNIGIFNTALGCVYSLSSHRTYITSDGNHVEEGATPDYDITKVTADGSVDYSNFFDLEYLCSVMDRHFHTKDSLGVGAENIGELEGQEIHRSPQTGEF